MLPQNQFKTLFVPPEFDHEEYFAENSNSYDFYNVYSHQKVSETQEGELWLGVLTQALWDYKMLKGTEEFEEIHDWFFKDTSEEIGSFRFVCNVLGFHRSTVLKVLKDKPISTGRRIPYENSH